MPYYDDQQKLEDFLKTNSRLEWSFMGFIDEINKLGDQYDLTLDELGLLYEETRKVLSGESSIDNLSPNISEGLKMYGAKQLAMDIETLIMRAKKNLKQEKELEKISTTTELEIPPTNLPMIESGEVAHEVPHTEPTIQTPQPIKPEDKKVGVPDYRYEGGKDPYREPLV